MNKINTSNRAGSFKPHHKVQLRADVAWALYQVLESGKSSRELLPVLLQRHKNAKDKGWLQEVFFGALRDLPKLLFWTQQLIDKPIKGDNKIIEHLIMVGLFQLHFMRTSDHAAVSETVEACKILKKPKFAGLVNAVLRNFQRNKIAELALPSEHMEHGFPKWLLKRLQSDYPQNWLSIVQASNQKAPIFLRINLLQTTKKDFIKALNAQDIEFTEFGDIGIQLLSAVNVPSLPGFEQGWFSVQDKAAQQCAHLLDVQPNEVVLDCCAAPGGKTAAILEACPTLKSLYAFDNQAKRLVTMQENLQRLNYDLSNVHILEADATKLTQQADLPQFDKILLDAPCSASGIIRRHPDIKWLRKASDISTLVELQAEILEQVWQKLKDGGTLLYATCSILPQENTQQIAKFLEKHDNAALVPLHDKETRELPGWQILPGEQQMDGFYYAKIKKLQ
ncbi:16S rRNA (cytosine(967)-C(5))-methyltransferase RsmB [Glaciecola sp. 1036]|uniref:16S rRNA (cytosine(967)-C(5))-methyltransferase RsmB n=1 Tax=Alteromonadaceae TaxID=72275 RepID=UPI003CFEDCB0